MMTLDSWYILMISRVSSLSLLHLLKRILQSFSRLTVSYVFWRSMRAAYVRLFLHYPGWIWVKSLETWVAVDVPSFNPV